MMTKQEKKSVLIIANGEPPEDYKLQELVKKSDLVIAADGGSNLCFQKNIYPDFIIGDLDSIESHVLAHFKDSEIIKIEDQNKHDLEKALDFVKTFQVDIIRVVAAFGKRLDHSMANLVLFQNVYTEFPLEFYDSYGRLTMVSHQFDITGCLGRTISLFSFLPVFGLTLQGFEFSLTDKDFPNGFNGLSNVVQDQSAAIQIKNGSLFIYLLNEDNNS